MNHTYSNINRVEQLKGRIKRCVCKYCGNPLELRRIIFSDYEDARVEIFCGHCERIEYGIEPEIYQSAKYFVEEMQFNCFADLDDNEQTRKMTIAKVCEIMSWGDKTLGFLNDEGFRVPLDMDETVVGECLVIEDEELQRL